MGFLRRIAGILGFSKDEPHETRDVDDDKDVVRDRTSKEEVDVEDIRLHRRGSASPLRFPSKEIEALFSSPAHPATAESRFIRSLVYLLVLVTIPWHKSFYPPKLREREKKHKEESK